MNIFPNEQISLSAEGEGPKEVEKETQQLERAFKPMPFLSKFWEMQVRVYSTEILSSARVFHATGRAIPSLPWKVFLFFFLQLFVSLKLVLQGFFCPRTNKNNLCYVLNVTFTIYSTCWQFTRRKILLYSVRPCKRCLSSVFLAMILGRLGGILTVIFNSVVDPDL